MGGRGSDAKVLFAAFPPKNQHISDVLDRGGIELLAHVLEQGLPHLAIGSLHLDLDEFVGLQGTIDLCQNTGGQSLSRDRDDGIQMVGGGAKFTAARGSQLDHGFLKTFRGMDSTPMKRTKTSKAWMQEHVTDPYVQRAKSEGYRSRAAYKLLEIDEKDHLLKPGMVVVDLGAAPGSWSQVALKRVGNAGKVFALDLLPIEPLAHVDFIQGDFQEDAVLAELEARLGGCPVDLVLSDMAPNMSGIDTADQARSIYLGELALDFVDRHLKLGGNFLIKVFQGSGFMQYRAELARRFETLQVRKPKASRDRSPEVYLLGLKHRGA